MEARQRGQEGTENMEEAARVISKAFTNCVTDRCCALRMKRPSAADHLMAGSLPRLSHGNGAYTMLLASS